MEEANLVDSVLRNEVFNMQIELAGRDCGEEIRRIAVTDFGGGIHFREGFYNRYPIAVKDPAIGVRMYIEEVRDLMRDYPNQIIDFYSVMGKASA